MGLSQRQWTVTHYLQPAPLGWSRRWQFAWQRGVQNSSFTLEFQILTRKIKKFLSGAVGKSHRAFRDMISYSITDDPKSQY